MKTNTRFIQSIVKTSQDSDVVMPWARGQRRKAFVEKRAAAANSARKTA